MKVCYFGIYNPNYTRSRVIQRALEENDIEVIRCRVDPEEKRKYWKLYKKHKKIGEYDAMIVGYPGHTVLPLARLICKKPIIFDIFISRYDSIILDRKTHSPFSLKALQCWLLDWLACRLPNKIILDGEKHIEYFVKTFKAKREKFIKLPVSADDNVFFPRFVEKDVNKFLVHFHGSFVPLQGVEYIIKAAKLLEKENVKFNLIGKGQTYEKAKKLAEELQVKNVEFTGKIPFEKVPEYLNKGDVSLGIFSTSPKAMRVVPCKLYEALACGKPIIIGESPVLRENFTNQENVLFCKRASGEDLAEKILMLKRNKKLREKIGRNGYNLFQTKFTPLLLGRKIKKLLYKITSH